MIGHLVIASLMNLSSERTVTEPGTASKSLRPTSEVVAELSRRSAIPEAELQEFLANCKANQQSMNFCAYRDQIAAELAFKRVVTDKKQKLPVCKDEIDTRVDRMVRARDEACEKSSKETWGEGSMKPVAQAICSTKETERMRREIQRIKTCPAAHGRP